MHKVVLLGASGIGKSSLITRIVDNTYVQNHIETIGVDFKLLNFEKEKRKFQIWDTSEKKNLEK